MNIYGCNPDNVYLHPHRAVCQNCKNEMVLHPETTVAQVEQWSWTHPFYQNGDD